MKRPPVPVPLKSSELRPCDACHAPLTSSESGPLFYLIDTKVAMWDRGAVNRLVGTARILGGPENPGAFRIAAVLTADDALAHSASLGRAILCGACYHGDRLRPNQLPELATEGEMRATPPEASSADPGGV